MRFFGSSQVALLSGAARLTTDATAQIGFAVQGKTPLLVTSVEDAAPELRVSRALERAELWPLRGRADGIDPAKMLVAHMKANKDDGLGAKLAGTVMSVPGLMQKGLKKDYSPTSIESETSRMGGLRTCVRFPHQVPHDPSAQPSFNLFSLRKTYSGSTKFLGAGPFLMRPAVS